MLPSRSGSDAIQIWHVCWRHPTHLSDLMRSSRRELVISSSVTMKSCTFITPGGFRMSSLCMNSLQREIQHIIQYNLLAKCQYNCINSLQREIQHNIQYNFIAKCQYNCMGNVLWCQVHSSCIHSNHKTLNYNNNK